MKKELELYIHIPFCVKKCTYCDFLSAAASADKIEEYVEALIREIWTYVPLSHNYRVITVFFGGGTPSILSGKQMKHILQALREVFEIAEDAEISMEANPGTVTMEKLEAYKKAGINRISFGLQSADNEELKLLGRIHTFEEFLESYEMARKCGFSNINIDLISAIPKQTLQSWEQTLQKVISLTPEHISAYSLIVEDGTPFAELYGEGGEREAQLPSEEEERQIYRRTEEVLSEAGYHRYEISNYAKEGFECRHNLGYWERKHYLGIGLGAASLIENVRYNHIDDLEFYIKNAEKQQDIEVNREELKIEEQIEEFLFLGLREMKGISPKTFEQIFGKSLQQCYGKNIETLKTCGLLVEKGDCLKLTKRGIDISNYVFAELLY